ncbi:Lar family restriction alleviation protein [Desulfosediminicola ganghwensis]|uniref:Lar family restriction alleviation protein n=1 Tax=Desulfosediminicola ganghwensis TaxID=2569540 RepID=UPI0010AD72DB|nr:Lar family restriction alleviation protein [Desulfosediminicola ganghwensis]
MTTFSLSPCPFCGSEAKLYEFHEVPALGGSHSRFNPGCANDGCFIEGWIDAWFKSKEEAAAAWNSRAIPLKAILTVKDALKDAIVEGHAEVQDQQLKKVLQSLAEIDAWLEGMKPSI